MTFPPDSNPRPTGENPLEGPPPGSDPQANPQAGPPFGASPASGSPFGQPSNAPAGGAQFGSPAGPPWASGGWNQQPDQQIPSGGAPAGPEGYPSQPATPSETVPGWATPPPPPPGAPPGWRAFPPPYGGQPDLAPQQPYYPPPNYPPQSFPAQDYAQPPYPPPSYPPYGQAAPPPPAGGPSGGWGPPPPGYYPPQKGIGGAMACAISGMVLALCCWPLGIALAIVGLILSRERIRQAEEMGYAADSSARTARALSIAAMVLSVLMLAWNLYMQISHPEMIEEILSKMSGR